VKKPFVCNGDFGIHVGNDIKQATEVLDILYSMGLAWNSDTAGRYKILQQALDSYGKETSLVIDRRYKKIYYGDDESLYRRPIQFSYEEFKKEVEEECL